MLLVKTLQVLGLCVLRHCLAQQSPTAVELQQDIITNVAEIPNRGPVPNFFEMLGKDLLSGTLVTKKFATVDELKNVKPVQEVTGRIVGGPFTMAEATRVAGQAVIRKMFPRSTFGEETVSSSAQSDDDRSSSLSQSSPLSPPRSRSSRAEKESVLLGKLAGQFSSRDEVGQKLGPEFLSKNHVPEVPGKILAKDDDIKFGRYKDNPVDMMTKFRRDGIFPEIVKGRILAGSIKGLQSMDTLPPWLAEAKNNRGSNAQSLNYNDGGGVPTSDLVVGNVVANARSKREVEEHIRRLGIAGQVQEVSGAVAADDIGRYVAAPEQKLRDLSANKVRGFRRQKRNILTGDNAG